MFRIPLRAPQPAIACLTLLLLSLAACTTVTEPPSAPREVAPVQQPGTADDYLARARQDHAGGDEADNLLNAADAALDDDSPDAARQLLDRYRETGPDADAGNPLHLRSLLLEARLHNQDDDPAEALRTLNTYPAPRWSATSDTLYRRWLELRIATLVDSGQHLAAVRDQLALRPLLAPRQHGEVHDRIWEMLGAIPSTGPDTQSASADSYELRGWLELLSTTRSASDNLADQAAAVERWRERWNRHPATDRLPGALENLLTLWENRPTRLALLLPLQRAAGNAVLEGFMGAYYAAREQELEVPEVRIYDSSDASRVPDLHRLAVEQGAELIIGPLDKEAVRGFQSRRDMRVPTLALNYTDNNRLNPQGLYQFGLAPEDDIRALRNAARDTGHRLAATLLPGGEEYQRIGRLFRQEWEASDNNAVITEAGFSGDQEFTPVLRRLLSIDQSEARRERVADVLPRESVTFIPRRRQDIDFLFLLASPEQGRQIAPTMDFLYAGDVPILAMPSLHEGTGGAARNRDLDGIRFVDIPWMLDGENPLRQSINAIWPASSGAVQRLRAMGADSFRLHTRLSQLINYPDTRVPGQTGTLTMRSDGAIQRTPVLATFSGGRAIPADAGPQ